MSLVRSRPCAFSSIFLPRRMVSTYEIKDANSMHSSRDGISVTERAGMASCIANNVIFDTTDVGICIIGDHNIVSFNSVDVVRTPYYPGIQIADGSYNEVVNNTITNCEEGITVETTWTNESSYNLIAYNRIENMAKYVVMVSGAEDVGNMIEHNTFVGSRTIIDRGTDTLIRFNN